jgi:hypothetical protein
MLGDGMVSFGVWAAEACSFRNVKASAKIVSRRCTRSLMRSAGGSNSMLPSSLKNCTCIRSSVAWPTPPSW